MAATSATLPKSCNGPVIDGCHIDTDPPSSHPAPVNLRIFFNPAQNLALLRMRAVVSASREPLFLDISPDQIQSLSFIPGPPTYLCFRVARITFIAPQEPLRPVTKADQAVLEALRKIAQQSAVRVFLPDGGGYETSQLVALCEAVARGGLRPDPTQTNLQSLYRGKGGRIIENGEELWPPPSLFSTLARPGDLLPPPSISSTARGDDLPLYSNIASDLPPPPLSPRPAAKKRRRTRTPSLSPSSSSPDYRTWKHLDLACGEREKMMCELLRRVAKKEKSIRDLMNDMEAKEALVDEKVANLTVLLAEVQAKEVALREAGGIQPVEKERERAQGPGASEASTASPTPSGGLASTVSVSSNISDRVQTYVTTQIDQLRDDIACEYATSEFVEQQVSDELELLLSRHVEEDQMFEAIREAIDEAMAGVRARVMEAWE